MYLIQNLFLTLAHVIKENYLAACFNRGLSFVYLFFNFKVSLYFAGCLYRGNRSTKVSAGSFDAFDSPNLPPLVTMKVKIEGKSCELLC